MTVRAAEAISRAALGLMVLVLAGCGTGTPAPDAGADDAGVAQDAGSSDAGPPDAGRGQGDLGTSCDPAAATGCDGFCVTLSDDSGLCTDRCDERGSIDCPEGYRCALFPDADDELVPFCLPNVSCGELTYQGLCDGTVLHYCYSDGPYEVECADHTGTNGLPKICAVVSESTGSNCVTSSGCGEETDEGRCEGDTVVACESAATGAIVRRTCAAEEECAINEDGFAACRAKNGAGCGTVTYEGECDGDTVVFCGTESESIIRKECTPLGQTCGYAGAGAGYWCVDPAGSNGNKRVFGRFLYRRPRLTRTGLGATEDLPVRHANVLVRRQSDKLLIASGRSDANGDYSVPFTETADVFVQISTAVNNAQYAIEVRNCPQGGCSNGGFLYGGNSPAVTPGAAVDLGTRVISDPNVTGAFAIFDTLLRGFDFARVNYGRTPTLVIGQWGKGKETSCQNSCFVAWEHTIYVLDGTVDTDPFDDPVVLHEFGHFLEKEFSESDNPGGSHDGSPTDPNLAWGEGYGTYVGSAIANSPLYIDSLGSGASVKDLHLRPTSRIPPRIRSSS